MRGWLLGAPRHPHPSVLATSRHLQGNCRIEPFACLIRVATTVAAAARLPPSPSSLVLGAPCVPTSCQSLGTLHCRTASLSCLLVALSLWSVATLGPGEGGGGRELHHPGPSGPHPISLSVASVALIAPCTLAHLSLSPSNILAIYPPPPWEHAPSFILQLDRVPNACLLPWLPLARADRRVGLLPVTQGNRRGVAPAARGGARSYSE